MYGQMMSSSCYFGHAPFASTYGGSLGISYGGGGGSGGTSFGSLFGIGKNTYQSTNGYMVGEICSSLSQ
jgi:hypothetical protein